MSSKPRSDEHPEPFTVNEVLATEFRALRPGWSSLKTFEPARAVPPSSPPRLGWLAWFLPPRERDKPAPSPTAADNLADLYARVHTESSLHADSSDEGKLTAICLSGGGIRSATFNLGVLQALAEKGLLGKFDYLSSVSGGGYIASWLRTWMVRTDNTAATVINQLGSRTSDPLHPEPEPLRNLRKFSNYLTPRLGLFSGDTWAAAGIITRNLLLNWLVVVPLIAALIALPLAFLAFVKSSGHGASLGRWLLVGALSLELFASTTVHLLRRAAKPPRTPQAFFVILCAIPIWLAASLLAWAAIELELPWLHEPDSGSTEHTGPLVIFAATWCIGIPLAGWLASLLFGLWTPTAHNRGWRLEMLALIVSGFFATPLLYAMVVNWLPALYSRPGWFVILATPLLLALYLLARTLFVGITSASEGLGGADTQTATEDADREWWARLSGWLLLMVTVWVAVTTLVFASGYLHERFDDVKHWLWASVGGIGGLAGAVAAFVSRSAAVPAGEDKKGEVSAVPKWALRLSVPLFVVAVIVLIAWMTLWLGEVVTRTPGIFDLQTKSHFTLQRISPGLGWMVIVMSAGLVALAAVAGMFVNVNRFSLHAMYRNRLVRAYLGASNLQRAPDPFTGFARSDNCELHDLWPEKVAAGSRCLLPIINTTLNLTQGTEDLAWQERKAESFSMTPFFCGNYLSGYRPSSEYGGEKGISVGTAISISGAAASPNMGYASSPALSFLMTLLNVRLGAWLGNTNACGAGFYRRPGPGQALRPLVNELLGRTNAQGRYVNLSDGGHFDNLGLYEVVLRRCRYAFVCDAGQDEKFAFEDLGNAIRKVRIDFGIPIEFAHKILIQPRSAADEKVQGHVFYCAVAKIRYDRVDSQYRDSKPELAEAGTLVYIKPTIGQLDASTPLPYDVYSYSRQEQSFPHQSTADQWFSESQFESYRALGNFLVSEMITRAQHYQPDPARKEEKITAPAGSIEEFVLRVAALIKRITDEK